MDLRRLGGTAHGLACLAEGGWDAPALVIALDGMGYGTDGQVWGGEILALDELERARLAHLSYLPLHGVDRATEQPWRMATAKVPPNDGGLSLGQAWAGVLHQGER